MEYVYLPMADIYLSFPLLFVIGMIGGVFSSMLGIGGGIIISPSLMSLGVPDTIAISTQLNNAVGTSFNGFLAYQKERDVDISLAWYFFIGGVAGALIEKLAIYQFETKSGEIAVLKIIVFAVLIIAGILTFIQSYITKRAPHEKGVMMRRWMIYFPWHKIFLRSRVEMSIIIPVGVGFFVGMVTTSLGGGNSLLIAPILTYLLGRSSRVVFGTSLLAGFGINLVVTIIFSIIRNAPIDCVLLPILVISSAMGSSIGARLSYLFDKKALSRIGAIALICIAIKMYLDLKASNWQNVDNNRYVFFEQFPLIMKKLLADPEQKWMAPIINYAHQNSTEYTIVLLIGTTIFVSFIHFIFERIFSSRKKY